MSRYFVKVKMTYTPKNNLHKEILTIFHSEDRQILNNEKEEDEFLNNLRHRINQANLRNKKCKPVTLETHSYVDDGALSVYVSSLAYLNIWRESDTSVLSGREVQS